MPGVNITTAVRTGPVGTSEITAGQVFMVGETERGPTDGPTLLRSFADYVTVYGNYQPDSLYMHVKTFFDEGGSRCYVQRVMPLTTALGNTAAVAGTVDLMNNVSPGPSTLITLTAANVGEWSDNLGVSVTGSTVTSLTDGFKILLYLDDVLVYSSRDHEGTVDGIVEAVNDINASMSHLVSASVDSGVTNGTTTDLAFDPVTYDLSHVLPDGEFTGGSDGAWESPVLLGGGIENGVIAALDLLSPSLESGAVCAPGYHSTDMWDALGAHAAANNRIAILSFSSATPAATARNAASAYYSNDNSSYMAFYWPHVKVDNPSVSELASISTAPTSNYTVLSPEAYVAGARARAIAEVGGPWRAAAGRLSDGRTIRGLAQDVTAATGEAMDAARVNAIRTIGNSIRIYGARSVSKDEANWRYITMRDTMNYISIGIEKRMEEYVFSTIDSRGNLFGLIRASIKAFLDPIRQAGGLYEAYDLDGNLIDPGYNVVVSSANNPTSQLATGMVKADVGVRVSGVADLISIVITKSNLSAPVI